MVYDISIMMTIIYRPTLISDRGLAIWKSFNTALKKITINARISAQIRPRGRIALGLIPSSSWSLKSIYPPGFFARLKTQEAPRPTKTLNTGPAMQPVKAISPNPFFVIATSAFKSPMQFPHERRVRPRSDLGSESISPSMASKSTTKFERNETH